MREGEAESEPEKGGCPETYCAPRGGYLPYWVCSPFLPLGNCCSSLLVYSGEAVNHSSLPSPARQWEMTQARKDELCSGEGERDSLLSLPH